MMNRSQRTRASGMVLVFTLIGGIVGAQNPSTPAFDVVSIKRNTSAGPSRTTPTPTGYVAVNVPFFILIGLAYPVRTSDQVSGAPDWFYDESYDVDARYSGTPSPAEQEALWRRLFADRLKLQARLETRVRDTFSLVLARPGRVNPNLKRTDVDCSATTAPDCTALGRGVLTTRGLSMTELARIIQPMTGRTVQDRSGLSGVYEFRLTFSPTRSAGLAPDADPLPDIFTALQEQLGLKLEPTRGPVNVLVIERIDRPSEN